MFVHNRQILCEDGALRCFLLCASPGANGESRHPEPLRGARRWAKGRAPGVPSKGGWLEAGKTACLRASLGQGTALLRTLCGRRRCVCSEVHRSASCFLPTFGSDSALCSRSVSRLSSEVPSLPSPGRGGTVGPVARVGFGCSGLLRCDGEGSRAAGGHGERVPARGPAAAGWHGDSNGALAASGGSRPPTLGGGFQAQLLPGDPPKIARYPPGPPQRAESLGAGLRPRGRS